jgi:hypothetical protein
MIVMLEPLSVGNAVRVILNPPAGSIYWRVLRNTTGVFPSENDPNSMLVSEGIDPAPVDTASLVNGIQYFYCVFYWSGTAWTAAAPASCIPNAAYQDGSTDAMTVVMNRLAAGLKVEVQRGALSPESGAIQVLSAPPSIQDVRWPVVTVHLLSEAPAERGVGEFLVAATPDLQSSGLWDESEGWLARVQLAVMGWSQNPDERIALRQALRRLIVANLPVFDANGMVEIEFSQQDVDAVSGEYPAAVYQTAGTFTCMAPVIVGDQIGTITDVQVTGTSTI